jgi:hypothetical protein
VFRKLGTKRSSRHLQSGVIPPGEDPKVRKIISNTSVADLVLREYKKEEFDEQLWRLKWEDFRHPHTGENGTQYLNRMKSELPFNPSLQKNSNVIIVIEPLYGPKR